MLEEILDKNEQFPLQENFQAKKASETPTLLQKIGRHGLAQPIVRGIGTLMMLTTTACTGAEAAGVQAQVSTHPSKAKTEQVFKDRVHKGPVGSFKNLQRQTLQRAAAQSFDYQSVTDMSAPTFADRCVGRAMTNPINGTFSVPMNDVLFYGRIYTFSDLPEYEAIARDPSSVANINVYLESVADFWRHFYGIQISHRTQAEPIPLGNFRTPDGQLVYKDAVELGNRGLQVAPAPRGDRPGQYVVPFDIYAGDATYPMIGRPLGNHGQVVFHSGPITDGVHAEYMEDAFHEGGHSFGLTHKTADPNEIMQARSSVQPFRVSLDSARENCADQTGPTTTPIPSGAHRVVLPISIRNQPVS